MAGCCALLFAALGVLLNTTGVFFKPVCDELGFSRGEFSAYPGIQALTIVVTLPLAGWLLPRLNLRILLSSLVVLMCGSVMAMSQFHSLSSWYWAAGFMGIGSGVLALLIAPILVRNWFHKHLGLAMGIVMACSGIGGALFNPITAWIITEWGWRTAYLALGITAMAIMLPFTLFVLRFQPSDVGLQPYGADEVTPPALAEAPGEAVKAPAPVEPPGVPAREAFVSPGFATLLVFVVGISIFVSIQQHIPGYASSLGHPDTLGASLVSLSMIGIILGKLGLGALNDRMGVYRTATLGLVLALIGVGCLLGGKLGTGALFPGAFLVGIGVALPTVQNPMLVNAMFGKRSYSQVFSVVSVVLVIVSAVGLPAVGFVFDRTGSFLPALLIIACALAAAMLAVPFCHRTSKMPAVQRPTGAGTPAA